MLELSQGAHVRSLDFVQPMFESCMPWNGHVGSSGGIYGQEAASPSLDRARLHGRRCCFAAIG